MAETVFLGGPLHGVNEQCLDVDEVRACLNDDVHEKGIKVVNVTYNLLSANSVFVNNVLLCSNSTNKISGGGTNTSNNTVKQTSAELERVKFIRILHSLS